MEFERALQGVWASIGPGELPSVRLSGDLPPDRSAFRVALSAAVSVGSVAAAVSEFTGEPAPAVDPSLALASFTTHVRVNGETVPAWAPLSGVYSTADDRFIQLHCNFAHHGAGVARRLGVPEDRSAFESAVRTWNAQELETALIDDNMIPAMLRTMAQWDEHPHARATAGLPLVSVRPLAEGHKSAAGQQQGDGPLAGLRVIDCSRVLAGPVAGRTLADLGADVIRVGADHLPHVEVCLLSTGTSKRNTSIDLRTSAGREAMTSLVRDADVLIDAFRPGALEAFGFGPNEIAAIAPGCSVVQISAFDTVGPWAGRRGYDSIVQSTTGIGLAGREYSDRDTPTPLPVQALDYTTGYFAAAAAIRAVHRCRNGEGSSVAELSLLRSRNWLVGLGGPVRFSPEPIQPTPDQLAEVQSDFGTVELNKPVLGRWHHGPRHLGTSPPQWM